MTGILITGLVFLGVFGLIYLFKIIIRELDDPGKHKWFK